MSVAEDSKTSCQTTSPTTTTAAGTGYPKLGSSSAVHSVCIAVCSIGLAVCCELAVFFLVSLAVHSVYIAVRSISLAVCSTASLA